MVCEIHGIYRHFLNINKQLNVTIKKMSLQVSKDNGASLFGRLVFCASKHIGAPYTFLKTCCLVQCSLKSL